MKTRQFILALAALTLGMASCQKDEVKNDDPQTQQGGFDALVLCEGSWGGNNASISALDTEGKTIDNQWFAANNGRGLGDVAQDLVVYGSKTYVTVWNSNTLEVIDNRSGHSTTVSLGSRGPRYIAADGGKLYISCYNPHSVIRIDTADVTSVEATVTLGDFKPEGIAAVGGKVFVASSNISDASGTYTYDDKVYAIDQATFSSATPIVVGCNPQKVMRLDNGHVVVNYWGDYAANPAGTAIIDATDNGVQQTGQALTNMTVADGAIYGYATVWSADYSSKTTEFYRIEGTTVQRIMEQCQIGNAYSIGVRGGEVFVGDDGDYSQSGDIHCLSLDGAEKWKLEAGMLPSKIVFL